MAEAKITLTLTPAEFDLIRESLMKAQGNAHRANLRTLALKLGDLMKKLDA